jgi:hypothetical protein
VKQKPVSISEVLKTMAESILPTPAGGASDEAAHAALLLAHVAWNRSLGHELAAYRRLLLQLGANRPSLWQEFASCDPEALIARLVDFKAKAYPTDRRIVLICGMSEGRIHVEWCHEEDFPVARKQVMERLKAMERTGVIQPTRRLG